MRLSLSSALVIPLLALMPTSHAESKKLSDYTLRIHIFRRSETTFYHHEVAEEAKGEGRANLFEGGEPKGLDFEFECSEKLKTSSGYETFPARWKKPNEELVVLMPRFGKADSYSTCDLKVQMKDFVYRIHNGNLESEPASAFKQWMTQHDYDPEHGKVMPTATQPAPPANSNPPK